MSVWLHNSIAADQRNQISISIRAQTSFPDELQRDGHFQRISNSSIIVNGFICSNTHTHTLNIAEYCFGY